MPSQTALRNGGTGQRGRFRTGAFAGFVRFDGGPVDRDMQERLAGAVADDDSRRTFTQRAPGAVFVSRTPYDFLTRSQSVRLGARGALFAGIGRLDNRAEVASALKLTRSECEGASDADLIGEGYARDGEAGIARCLGVFAFAHWDPEARRLSLARDYFGKRALFFHRGEGFAAFASSLRVLLSLPHVPREIDDAMLIDFIAVNYREPRKTIYRGIERVPTRSLICLSPRRIEHSYYWSPRLDVSSGRSFDECVEQARVLFDQAVATAAAGRSHIAVSASGGLDSSAIAATLARLGCAERITCYTMMPPSDLDVAVPPHRYRDEHDKMLALHRMYPGLDLRFLSPEDAPMSQARDVRRFMRIPQPMHAVLNLDWFEGRDPMLIADGHDVILSGVRGNYGLSWTGQFSLLALLRQGRILHFARELLALARQSQRSLARTFVAEALVPGAGAPLRRHIHRLRGRPPYSVARYSALHPALAAEPAVQHRWNAYGFDPWFVPTGWQSARHRAFFMFDMDQATRDQVAMSADFRGIEMRDPHADRRLVELALNVPEYFYRRNGVPRSFARAVFADRLPPEILNERRRGLQGGGWFRRLEAERAAMAEEVAWMQNSPRISRLLDVPRLRRLMEDWPADEGEAELRLNDYRNAFARAIHVARFIRWAEGGNA